MEDLRLNDPIVAAAVRALGEIVRLLADDAQPAPDGYVTLVVRDYEPTHGPAPVLATLRYRWREHGEPLALDERTHRAATVDPVSRTCIAPVWVFELTPIGDDDWYFGCLIAAARTEPRGLLFHARRRDGCWAIEWPGIANQRADRRESTSSDSSDTGRSSS